MALRTARLRPLQDENAENPIVSGKAPGAGGLGAGNKALGLKSHQQPLLERKKLSNITNQLNSAKGKVATENGGGKAAPQTFSVKVDAEFAPTKAGLQDASAKIADTPRIPLKNLTNGGNQRQEQSHGDDSKLPKQKANAESQSKSTAKFKFPPSSRFQHLTEDMKKKAALWGEEGIERTHHTGKDMEELREKTQEEEIAQRVAMTLSLRSNIPFPRLRPLEDYKWEFPAVHELDLLHDLHEDAGANCKGLDGWSPNNDLDEALLGYADYLAVCSPPRFTAGWPEVMDDATLEAINGC